jgi:hypothetical protein
MKLLLVLASLFVASQAQFSIGAPKAGTTLQAGQNVSVQIIVPINTSAFAGQVEVSLVIGIVACGTSACPAPSADLGQILFLGKYQSQGVIGNTLNSFENFTFVVPSDISGKASIQVQHIYALTPPGHALPGIEYTSVGVQVTGSTVNIHPDADNSKCVGILGGTYANGAAVDIYDCNGSATQKWRFNENNGLTSVNPADGSQWCLDAGVQSQWANGVKMKIWQCFANLPQQTWTTITTYTSGKIKLPTANFCLDLTGGSKTNRNVLQIWTCGDTNLNQLWTLTSQ